ncbi:FRG domain-containing protein [Sorangium sp. So ce341]|uniref:FRG domain-containing protein n=1 Tax=Sorangium sp. So ce341 TaxID=3133302 RepID=UPI003F61BA0A
MKTFSRASDLWDALSPTRSLYPDPSRCVFRGQADASWSLVPKVLRSVPEERRQAADFQVFYELRLLKIFCESCDQIGLRTPLDTIELHERHLDSQSQDQFFRLPDRWPNRTLLELMAMAQHHGVDTRLLDWSWHAYTACYFAATSALESFQSWTPGKSIAIWVLNIEPRGLVADVVEVIRPPGSVTPHLAAQAGLFTLQKIVGQRGQPLDTPGLEAAMWGQSHTSGLLMKLTLPVFQVVALYELCNAVGINAATLYRSADGAARSTRELILASDARQWLINRGEAF